MLVKSILAHMEDEKFLLEKSSYHIHKLLEEVEIANAESLPDDFMPDWGKLRTHRLNVIIDDLEDNCRAILLKRFRSQLDQRHEEETIEDWNLGTS